MRIGQVADQRLAELHRLRRHVGVVVVADDDGHVRADRRAHAPQQLALAVLEILADAGAVQVEIDRVDRHLARQRADQLGGDALERVARDDRAGAARGPDRGHQLVPVPHQLEEARQREIRARQPVEDLFVAAERRPVAMRGEIGEVRHAGNEAVGLVVKAADRDARHLRCSGCGNGCRRAMRRRQFGIPRAAPPPRCRGAPKPACAPRSRTPCRCRGSRSRRRPGRPGWASRGPSSRRRSWARAPAPP